MRFRSMPAALLLAALFSAISTVSTPTPAQAASTSTHCLPASLKNTIAKLNRKFGRIKIISSHRPGARIAGSGRMSYHASCRAVDFHPPKGKYRAVVAWLKKHHRGGLGTYSCGMHHIHIDNGPKVKWHKCQGSGTTYARRRTRTRRARTYAPQYYYGGGLYYYYY